MAAAQVAARALGQRQRAVLHLHGRMGLAAQLAHGLDDLGDAAAVGRVVVAQAATVGVEGQPAHAADQVAVGDEAPALALGAEAQVLELQQHGDGEAVVDAGVLDVGWSDAGLRKGDRPADGGAGGGEVQLAGKRMARSSCRKKVSNLCR